MSPEIQMGTDDQYLECWLQLNVTYRANVALACYQAAAFGRPATKVAAALECFQQYLFAIEDLATWADVIPKWGQGESLSKAVEVANARWAIFETLKVATRENLVTAFSLPEPAGFRDQWAVEYQAKLDGWVLAARDVGTFASRQAQNGGQLANRLQNKMKHGLHFAVGQHDGNFRVHFYPHPVAQPLQEMPILTLTSERALDWLRRTYDVCRLLAALLKTLFVYRFERDPLGAWSPRSDPSRGLTSTEIAEDLQLIRVPRVQWVGDGVDEVQANA